MSSGQNNVPSQPPAAECCVIDGSAVEHSAEGLDGRRIGTKQSLVEDAHRHNPGLCGKALQRLFRVLQVVKAFVEHCGVVAAGWRPVVGIHALELRGGVTPAGLVDDKRVNIDAGIVQIREQLSKRSVSAANLKNALCSTLSQKSGEENEPRVIRPAANGLRIPINQCFHFATIAAFLLLATSAFGELVQSTNRIPWRAGYSVGSQLARTNRTVSVNVTNFGADASGVTNASPSIQAAIDAAAVSGGVTNVIYFPEGRYRIVDGISLPSAAYSGLTLRGATNVNGVPQSILFGQDTGLSPVGGSVLLYVGPGDNPSVYYPITSGATKGSTNLVLGMGYVPGSLSDARVATVTNIDASLFSSGYIIEVAGDNGSNPEWNVISTGGYDNIAKQHAYPIAVAGQTITISSPLVMDFSSMPNTSAYIIGTPPIRAVSIEFLKLVGSNSVSGATSTQQNMLTISHAVNSWIIGCEIESFNNYGLSMAACVNVTVQRNKIHKANSAGSNHGGILFNASSCLVEDNSITDGMQPSIEINGGMGNAFFGNFTTNNIIDLNIHNAHPAFNLFEANTIMSVTWDGYFGSTSHHTFLRNHISRAHIYFKRWTTFQQVLGNVIGSTDYLTNAGLPMIYTSDIIGYEPMIFSFGKPNIGNGSHTGTNGPISWNYPGNVITLFDPQGDEWTNGVFTITNAPAFPTNQIWTNYGIGQLTNLHAALSAGYPLFFQDTLNTNTYYSGIWNGQVLTGAGGNSSNITISVYMQLSNNWRLFIGGQNQWQQLQASNRHTHTIVSNLVYTNLAGVVANDAIAVGVGSGIVSNSFLYPTGAPDYWGTNRWPAMQFSAAQPVSPIPSEDRYFGRFTLNENPPDAPTLSALGCATSVRLTWIPNGSAATTYHISRGTSSGMLTPLSAVGAVTTTDDTGLVNGTPYFYVVIASNIYGASSASSEVSATPVAAPGTPTGLAATPGDAQVTLSWNAVSGASGYYIRRGTSSGALTLIATEATTSYTDTGRGNGTEYFYDVAAFNACNTGSYSSEVSATPTAPGGGEPVATGPRTITRRGATRSSGAVRF